MDEEFEKQQLASDFYRKIAKCHILLSFGATDTILSFFTILDVIRLQLLNFWMYARGVARV